MGREILERVGGSISALRENITPLNYGLSRATVSRRERSTRSTTVDGASAGYVEVIDVSHAYPPDLGGVQTLANITFSLSRNEIVCILGPSGCGKTTLLRIIAGLLEPDSGTVRIDGTQIRGVPRGIGFIFQDYENSLMKWRTVYENIAIGAEMAGTSGDAKRTVVNRHIELTGLRGFEDSRIDELSGGMKQRVQVARVLAYDPEILLCDEPFGALDLQTKERLQDKLLEILKQRPRTTLFVTHDIEEAIYLADRIIVLSGNNPGRVETIEHISFDRPRTPKSRFEESNSTRIMTLKNELKGLIES